MENFSLKLSETEQLYYQELFSACDVDNLGKALAPYVAELFQKSNLPPEKIEQVTELCGAKLLSHFNRNQFFKALKLIAAAQNGLPISAEVLESGIECPLPKFDVEELKNDIGSPSRQIPVKLASTGSNNIEKSNSHFPVIKHVPNDSQVQSPQDSISPKETVTTKDKLAWISFHNDESKARQLHSDHDHSSDHHSSDDDCDIWIITAEQEEYYTNQFKLMQTDVTSKISGSIAKDFFEKSKLPVHELSKIWQLSDIDKDGALSLAEFCTAMHLVVLRRNNIELPDALPISLIPKVHMISNNSETIVAPEIPVHKTSNAESTPDHLSPQNKEWTKFVESPTSTLSSPSAKPVSFDFSAASVEQNPQIFHPVALRVTPDYQTIADNGTNTEKNGEEVVNLGGKPVVSQVTVVHSKPLQGPKKEPPPPPPPRPKSKKNHARSSSLDLNRISKGDRSFLHQSSVPPPSVPPRSSPSSSGAFEVYKKPGPTVKHTSSRSLDYDTSTTVLDPSECLEPLGNLLSNEVEVEKKRYPSAPSASGVSKLFTDKHELQLAVCKYRERNLHLTRLNSELNQELSEVMEERIALEIQLEHIKPLSF